MNNQEYFIYLSIIVLSTYLIRVIPFSLIKNKIKNQFFNSFLHYIPYTVLTAMTFPAVFYSTSFVLTASVGVVVALILSLKEKTLTTVAMVSCLCVLVAEIIMLFL